MTVEEVFRRTGQHRCVLLTTFRRNGLGVATTVRVARDGDGLVVTTPACSGKVARLRSDERVLLSPRGRLGRVASGAPSSPPAEVLGPEDSHPGAVAALRAEDGRQHAAVTGVERALRRRRRRGSGRLPLALRPDRA